jgi:hypothetical protein
MILRSGSSTSIATASLISAVEFYTGITIPLPITEVITSGIPNSIAGLNPLNTVNEVSS